MKQENRMQLLWGCVCGFLNGLFGSGAGVVAVLALRRFLKSEQQVHATAAVAILILSAASFLLYLLSGSFQPAEGLRYLPGGLAGAAFGAAALRRVRPQKLRRLFGFLVALSGGVMLFS